ncbi:unnamed protein product [Cuscuta campestris]|uniref:Uncharacterized protein n=1 Tax=Cuscuta campestris TaxID=132261 RepID=A0A484KJ02_9ASTE|nr:unnamed protein product [Cuscuta campestris]
MLFSGLSLLALTFQRQISHFSFTSVVSMLTFMQITFLETQSFKQYRTSILTHISTTLIYFIRFFSIAQHQNLE